MELYIMNYTIKGIELNKRDIPKLRGFLASSFPEHIELHNHRDDNKFEYGYPFIQYKVINDTPTIIAINNAALTVYDVMNKIGGIRLGDKLIKDYEGNFVMDKYRTGIINKMLEYKFISPWVALNQANYKEYVKSDENEKNELLKKVLKGNILSMAKYMNYWIEEQLNVEVNLKVVRVNYKNHAMTAFKGSFKVNFIIPDYLGLGKSVSRGFGTVKMVGGV